MLARSKLAAIFVGLIVCGGGLYRLVTASPPIAKDVERRALWDGRSTVRFHALTSPDMVPAAKADFMSPMDYVLGVTIAGQSRAYPSSYVGFHHVVNDKVFSASNEASWFAVTYCDMCGTAILYDATLDGKTRDLEFYGLYNGTIALCDRETQSVFLPNTGQFVTGPLLGKKLKMGALLDTTWTEWKRLHGDTLVMSPDATDREYYAETSEHKRAMSAFPKGMEFFAPTVTRTDTRLDMFERILGVSVPIGGATGKAAALHRAYTFKALQASSGAVEDRIGDEPVTVLFDPKTVSAVAVSPKIDGSIHHFEAIKAANGDLAFIDKETGTHWTIEGHAVSGPLSGHDLARLNSFHGEWYAWAAFFPDTSLYRAP